MDQAGEDVRAMKKDHHILSGGEEQGVGRRDLQRTQWGLQVATERQESQAEAGPSQMIPLSLAVKEILGKYAD